MLGVRAAPATIFTKGKLLGCVERASLRHIILALAEGADEPDDQALFFLGHRHDYTLLHVHSSSSLLVTIVSTTVRAKSCRPLSE